MNPARPYQIWLLSVYGALAVGCIALRIAGWPLSGLLTTGGVLGVVGIQAIGAIQKRREERSR